MLCFSREKLSIDDHDESLILVALLGWVWPHNFFIKALARRTPSTMQQFMDKVVEFMNAEDTIKAFTDQSQRGSNNSDKKKERAMVWGAWSSEPTEEGRGAT